MPAARSRCSIARREITYRVAAVVADRRARERFNKNWPDCCLPMPVDPAHNTTPHDRTPPNRFGRLMWVLAACALASGAGCPRVLQQYTQTTPLRAAVPGVAGADHRGRQRQQLARPLDLDHACVDRHARRPDAVGQHRVRAAAVVSPGGQQVRPAG